MIQIGNPFRCRPDPPAARSREGKRVDDRCAGQIGEDFRIDHALKMNLPIEFLRPQSRFCNRGEHDAVDIFASMQFDRLERLPQCLGKLHFRFDQVIDRGD